MGLTGIRNKLAKIDLEELAYSILEDMEVFIADLNREQMAKYGIREDGSEIEPEYAPLTEILKRSKTGIAGIIGHVTLFDTGNFHKSILTDIGQGKITLDATDVKLDDLEQKYGSILGLTNDNIEKVKEEYNKRFTIEYNKLTNDLLR